MSWYARRLVPLDDRGPLRVMFLITSMPVGGAEMLLVNLVRRMDRDRFAPYLCCMKQLGPLGELLAGEIPAFYDLTRHKYDAGVLSRLVRLLRSERIDALVTVGAGDKMFWGRLAARRARLPVVLSAIHSTGWPDAIGRLNRSRLLTYWTDGFIGVANEHARHLREVERFPDPKVHVIPNGVDVDRFKPYRTERLRRELGLDDSTPLVGIVAALRPEKNHELFLRAAARVREQIPRARFVVVGDGPQRGDLERLTADLGLGGNVFYLGTRVDIPDVLAALDVFVLTSKMEANPVSILEAMASGKPVIAPRVGSIPETVFDGQTGYLIAVDDLEQLTARVCELLSNPTLAGRFGAAARAKVVENWSLERMVDGYEELIEAIYTDKCRAACRPRATARGTESAASTAAWYI